jgi:hypothetical protein
MLAAKAMGADTVIMTGKIFVEYFLFILILYLHNKDISQSRLDFAKKIGASHVVLAENDPQKTADRVVEILGSMPNISIECSGAESSIQATFYVSHLYHRKRKIKFLFYFKI